MTGDGSTVISLKEVHVRLACSHVQAEVSSILY